MRTKNKGKDFIRVNLNMYETWTKVLILMKEKIISPSLRLFKGTCICGSIVAFFFFPHNIFLGYGMFLTKYSHI